MAYCSMPNNRQVGNDAESLACAYLRQKDFQILERNFTIFGGEIDIIAQKDDLLVFVEVKARYTHEFGLPEEAITERKINFLRRTVHVYLSQRQLHHLRCRVDLVAIDFTQSKNYPSIRIIENIVEDYC